MITNRRRIDYRSLALFPFLLAGAALIGVAVTELPGECEHSHHYDCATISLTDTPLELISMLSGLLAIELIAGVSGFFDRKDKKQNPKNSEDLSTD